MYPELYLFVISFSACSASINLRHLVLEREDLRMFQMTILTNSIQTFVNMNFTAEEQLISDTKLRISSMAEVRPDA